MQSAVSRREWLLRAGAAAAGIALGHHQPVLAESSARAPTLAVEQSIEPNTIKRRGTGFHGYDPQRTSPGLTLFAPLSGTTVYLVDLQGDIHHTWKMPYPPGFYGYLTDKGTLLYSGSIANGRLLGKIPWPGGAVLEVDWNGNVLWEVRQADHHHDARLLPNGNVLLLCARTVPEDVAQQVSGGLLGTEAGDGVYADYLVEMTTAGQTVWEWRIWEHLDPATHPITLPSDTRAEWTHGNAIIDLPGGDILLSLRNISTIVRINRRTEEIDWELGPPPLSGAHGVNPLPNGNLLIFDNGPYRVDQSAIAPTEAPFSRVIEVDPNSDAIVWKYQEPTAWNFFSSLLSNAQRLANGNTLVTEGLFGRMFEVTPDGDTVWEYVNPFFGPSNAAPKAQTNVVFRSYRYTADEIARAQSA